MLGSFLFVLYREGLNKWLCIPVLLIAALFIVSFLLSPMTLLVSIILVCTLSEAMMTGEWRSRLIYLASLALASILLCMTMALVAPGVMDLHACLLTVTLLSLVGVLVYAFRMNLSSTLITVGLFLCTMIFLPTTDYIFNSILKQHQRDRILSFWASSAIPSARTTTSTSRKSPSVRADSGARDFSKARRSSTVSCPNDIPTSSSVRSAKSGAFWGRWSCWPCSAC